MTTTQVPVIARLTGRCANGAERDGGRRSHVVMTATGFLGSPSYAIALCGARPGRLSNGWVEVDGAEQPTCPRCSRKAEREAERYARQVAPPAWLTCNRVTIDRPADVLPTLNHQVQWVLRDLAAAGAKTRRSQALVTGLSMPDVSSILVTYADGAVCKFRYNLEDLTPSVRNPHFVCYGVEGPDGMHFD